MVKQVLKTEELAKEYRKSLNKVIVNEIVASVVRGIGWDNIQRCSVEIMTKIGRELKIPEPLKYQEGEICD